MVPGHKARIFLPLAATILLADCTTKRSAEHYLVPGVPEPIVGDILRFTLAYNQGAGFGISLGTNSRTWFILLGVAAVLILGWLYVRLQANQPRYVLALGLAAGGALGNLLDRFASPAGVVDFIDVGIGAARWWTFNVADMGITAGAVLLLTTLWGEEGNDEAGHSRSHVEPGGPNPLEP